APEEWPRIEALWSERHKGNWEHDSFELNMVRKDGSRMLVSVRAGPVTFDGEVTSTGTVRDITESRRAAGALQQSEEKYRTLVNYSQDGIFVAEQEIYIYVNPAYAEMLGYTPSALIGKRWIEVIAPEDYAKVNGVLQSREVSDGEPTEYEIRLLHKDARTRVYVSIKSGPVHYGGKVVVQGTVHDITEVKRSERELKRREETFRSLAENLPDLILRFDKALTCTYASNQSGGIFGTLSGELVNINLQDLKLPEAVIKTWHEAIVRVFETGETEEQEVKFTRSGAVSFLESRFVPEFGVQWAIESVLVISRDITPRKETEKKLRRYAERLKILSRQLLQVQESERRHIARELHDEVGQNLTALKLKLQSMQCSVNQTTAPLLEENISYVDQLLGQVRAMSLDLRPSMLDDLGLEATLRWYISRQAQLAEIKPHIHIELSSNRLPAEIETSCFRIVQEAVTNILRHADAQNLPQIGR
ncbi:MAG: PAS domain S-box protein, partial [Gammaproteobacteria bacterium]|nr:PAS domain S-box protein [Gammaproteobacteria bacterium]